MDTRHGANWDAFLKQYRLAGIDGDSYPYTVRSLSGKTYSVDSKTKLDEMGSMYFKLTCTCPARGHCRHIEAVENMRYAEADGEDMEVIERAED